MSKNVAKYLHKEMDKEKVLEKMINEVKQIMNT